MVVNVENCWVILLYAGTWCQDLLVVNSSDAWYVPLVFNCIIHFIDLNFLLLLLECTIMFQFEVDSFTLHNKNLQLLYISEDEWEAVKLICGWLLNFREATKQMSTTSKPCFQKPMPFFVAFKMPLNQFMQIYCLPFHTNSRLAFLMLIKIWVNITTSMMNLHFTHGPHVSYFKINAHEWLSHILF